MTTGVPACLRCGSIELHMPASADGGVVGTGLELNEWACGGCGWKGIPVFFDDAEALAEFRATLTDADGS